MLKAQKYSGGETGCCSELGSHFQHSLTQNGNLNHFPAQFRKRVVIAKCKPQNSALLSWSKHCWKILVRTSVLCKSGSLMSI